MSFPNLYGGALSIITKTLGEEVTYRPRKGGTFTINGIFDEVFRQVDPDTKEVIASNAPRVGIKLKDIPFLPQQGDDVTIRQKRYKVKDSQEDGLGGTTIFLTEV